MTKLLKNPLVQCAALLAGAAVLAILKSPVAQESAITRASGAPRRPSHFPSDLPAGKPRDSFQVTMAGSKDADRPDRHPGIPVLTEIIPAAGTASQEVNRPTAGSPQISTRPRRNSRHRSQSDPLTRDTASPPSSHAPALVVPVVMEEARMPVASAISDLDVTAFTPQEQSAIHDLRDSFTETIAAEPSQDPASHEYFDHWKCAARLHDEQLRITLGWDRFNRLSAVAARNATASP